MSTVSRGGCCRSPCCGPHTVLVQYSAVADTVGLLAEESGCANERGRLKQGWKLHDMLLTSIHVLMVAHGRKFSSAIAVYERALSVAPRTASTFTAIGYTWHLQVL